MISPDCDITPLLGSKLPQLQLVMRAFPVYEVVDISVGVVSYVYLFGGGAVMSTKERKGPC